jgi:hypothetical protein
MLARLTSLRFWLVVAMLSAALVGLAGAYLIYGKIQASQERSSAAQKTVASRLRSPRRRKPGLIACVSSRCNRHCRMTS